MHWNAKMNHTCEVRPKCDRYTSYFNELACQCFSLQFCNFVCPPDKVNHPVGGCDCISQEDVKALYPSWATEEDIQEAE